MTAKEREIIDWEFESLLRHIVASYIKLTGFDSFDTYIDTHQDRKEIYDIKIIRRVPNHE